VLANLERRLLPPLDDRDRTAYSLHGNVEIGTEIVHLLHLARQRVRRVGLSAFNMGAEMIDAAFGE